LFTAKTIGKKIGLRSSGAPDRCAANSSNAAAYCSSNWET
jgi:hypothetical protein